MGTVPLPQELPTEGGGWVVEHDERRSFLLPYLLLSVGFSLFVSLFWLVVLVGIHLGLELARARRLGLEPPLPRALWEVKLDIGLLLLALSMAIYMDLAFGILGLGASSRAGGAALRLGARSHLLRRVVRAFFLVLDDIVRVLGVVVAARGIRDTQAPVAPEALPPWRGRWSWGDRIALSLLATVSLLLALSPWFSGHGLGEILAIIWAEFHPWP